MRARAISRAGFTLIELMVVLVVIGIFSGLILGDMRGTYEDAILRSTARKIISAANLANSQAVTLSRVHSLIVEPESSRFRIQMAQENGSIEEQNLDSRIKIDIRDLITPSDDGSDEPRAEREQKQRNLDKIDFFPDGTADGREIVLRDRMGVELSLRINPVTGRIRVVENEVGR